MDSKNLKEQLKQDEKIISAIGYIWLLFLIPLLLKKDSEYCQFHAKQGMLLFVFSLAVMILGGVPVLGWLIITPLGWIAILILTVIGFVNALSGKKWEMPILGKWAKKIDL
jgi:uncharacterized membrane protein